MKLPPLVAVALAAALAAPLAGGAPVGGCGAGGGDAYWCGCYIDWGGKVYLAIDAILSGGYVLSVWVYAETNGDVGLQRGGSHALLGYEDPCLESLRPDLMIF